MQYPGYDTTQGRGAGFSNKFNGDSRVMGQATAALRSFVQQRIVDGNPNEIDRITKYYLYWKFYEGEHYRDNNDAMLSFNYMRAFIDKVNMFLLGKDAFSFQAKDFMTDQVDKEFESWVEKALQYSWNKSQKRITAYELLQMGSVCGSVWAVCEWQAAKKFVKVKVLDSRQCFPQFRNGDIDDLESFMVRYSLPENTKKYKVKVYLYTKEKVEWWYQQDTTMEAKRKFEPGSKVNPYGFIPIVHIKNRPHSPGYFGKSDMNDTLKINKVYNESMQKEKAILDYHAEPTTVITGGTARNLQRGLGKIWSGLPPEANVFNLGLDVDLTQLNQFNMNLKTAMHELSDVPENALGKLQAISNTSAAALEITYQPLIQQADLKAITYGEGITELNTMILQVHTYHDKEFKPLEELRKLSPDFLDTVRVEPVFTYGLPKDRQNELNMGIAEIQAKIGSRREVMERLGKHNVPDLMDEIDEDAEEQLRMEMEANGMVQGQNTPNNGQPLAASA